MSTFRFNGSYELAPFGVVRNVEVGITGIDGLRRMTLKAEAGCDHIDAAIDSTIGGADIEVDGFLPDMYIKGRFFVMRIDSGPGGATVHLESTGHVLIERGDMVARRIRRRVNEIRGCA